uniref:Ribosomal protein n=1 Tax=Gopherus evgoodei TaxID=1825980 RepID=A0A8C4VHX5_9SAUR
PPLCRARAALCLLGPLPVSGLRWWLRRRAGRGLVGQPLLANSQLPVGQTVMGMKTKGVIKRRCKDCFIVRRRGRLFVYCKTHPRHKQRQA